MSETVSEVFGGHGTLCRRLHKLRRCQVKSSAGSANICTISKAVTERFEPTNQTHLCRQLQTKGRSPRNFDWRPMSPDRARHLTPQPCRLPSADIALCADVCTNC